jgi:hypothetical protein
MQATVQPNRDIERRANRIFLYNNNIQWLK